MHLARTEEQQELAATVRALLTRRSDSAAVRAAIETPEGYDTGLWQALCEQVGVAALPIPEQYDGFGATLVETAVVLEELGENLTPAPLLASTLAAVHALLHGSEAEREELLPDLAAGRVVPFTLGRVVLEPDERTPAMDQTLRLALAAEPGERTREVLAQRAAIVRRYVGDSSLLVASEVVQLHGGIAITWEHDAQLLFKRAHALSQLNGPAHRHRASVLT